MADIFHRVKRAGKDRIGRRAASDAVWACGTHQEWLCFCWARQRAVPETVVRAKPGDVINLAGKEITFAGVEARQGPNYVTSTAMLDLRRDGQFLARLEPENRLYTAQRQTTTEAAIRPRLTGDDYAVLGDGDARKGYTLRLYHKPLVSWIWAGAGLMALGGLLAAVGRARLPHQSTELDTWT